MINILLLAPPAAGKGTQSELLEKKYNIAHISTGNLLRDASRKRDELGNNLREILKTGKLVSDDIVLEVLNKKFHEVSKKGFLLDGFPRNINQAIELDKILCESNLHLDYVFFLDVSSDILEKRITGRRMCSSCGKIYNINNYNNSTCICGGELYQRDDDTKEAFEIRYQTYLDLTLPLVDYYQKQGILYKVNASLEIEEVNKEITSIINKKEVSND